MKFLGIQPKQTFRWGRLIGNSQLDESNIEGTPSRPPWSSNFLGSKREKRRSRSVEIKSPSNNFNAMQFSQRTENRTDHPIPAGLSESKLIGEIIKQDLRKGRRRSRSIETPSRIRREKDRYDTRDIPKMPQLELDETFEVSELDNPELFINPEPEEYRDEPR